MPAGSVGLRIHYATYGGLLGTGIYGGRHDIVYSATAMPNRKYIQPRVYLVVAISSHGRPPYLAVSIFLVRPYLVMTIFINCEHIRPRYNYPATAYTGNSGGRNYNGKICVPG